jgi:hypothetical protein
VLWTPDNPFLYNLTVTLVDASTGAVLVAVPALTVAAQSQATAHVVWFGLARCMHTVLLFISAHADACTHSCTRGLAIYFLLE